VSKASSPLSTPFTFVANLSVYHCQKRFDATTEAVMTKEVHGAMFKKVSIDVRDLDIGITNVPFEFVPLAHLASEILLDKRA
jgi:hypothetical protein